MRNQTSKSPIGETPKKMGRPRGRKSDPGYRQVTIYIPTALHDKARQMVVESQLSANKTERQDFSGLVEMLLVSYFQTSESPETSLKLIGMADEFRNQTAEIEAMSEERWTLFSQQRKGPSDTEDTEDTENDKEIAEVKNWAAQGLITAVEFKKIEKLMTYSGRITGQEADWMISVRKRVKSKISDQNPPPERNEAG